MKDLKHLIFFENLLQDAQNELVEKARNEGQLALGYNCYYIPEVLLNLPGCFSSRLRAPPMRDPFWNAQSKGDIITSTPFSERKAAQLWTAWRVTSS